MLINPSTHPPPGVVGGTWLCQVNGDPWGSMGIHGSGPGRLFLGHGSMQIAVTLPIGDNAHLDLYLVVTYGKEAARL